MKEMCAKQLTRLAAKDILFMPSCLQLRECLRIFALNGNGRCKSHCVYHLGGKCKSKKNLKIIISIYNIFIIQLKNRTSTTPTIGALDAFKDQEQLSKFNAKTETMIQNVEDFSGCYS